MTESFFTDADLSGTGEFVEGQTSLGTRMTLAEGTVIAIRIRFPAGALTGTTTARLYNIAGTLLGSVAAFDTITADAWNIATFASPIAVTAGDYVVTYVTPNRYVARTGFFTGGPITRGNITAKKGRFAGGDAFPSSDSDAMYTADVVWAPASSSESVSDSGTEAETATVAAAAGVADAATLDELQALAVAASLADLATLADTATTAVTAGTTDAFTLAETVVIDVPGQSRPAAARHLTGPQRAAHYSGPQTATAYRG